MYVKNTPLSLPLTRLHIDIAEGTSQRVTRIADRDIRRAHESHTDDIVERSVAARGCIVHGDGGTNGILPVLEVQVLPRPVHAVDHGVVEEEGRVAGRDEEITSRVTADGKVAAGVDA